jgi:hypothetical protein
LRRSGKDNASRQRGTGQEMFQHHEVLRGLVISISASWGRLGVEGL